MTMFNRRDLLMAGGLAAAHGPLSLVRATSDTGSTIGAPHNPGTPVPLGGGRRAHEVLPSFPSTDPELVTGVLIAAHTDLDTVVELVTDHPHLARASVDWGFGDWESALGAASHMGRRDIAEFLIDNGARPNIFSAAMFGQIEVVKALVTVAPGVQRIPGPHGITLLAHARNGGEAAAPVVEYLDRLGDADTSPETVTLTDEQRRQFVGTYGFDAAGNDVLEIADRRGVLSIRRDGLPFGRRMFAVSETEFFPTGSPTVRIIFQIEGGQATKLRVIDKKVILTAARLTD